MIAKHSIDEKTAKHVSKILKEDPEPDARATARETLDFYIKNYPLVQIVRCDLCGADLCLEVLIPAEVQRNKLHHHDGLRRIVLDGGKLLSSRKRLDGAMGYECRCGNNTINASVEIGLLPTVSNITGEAMIPQIEPHHEAMVKLEIAKQHYTPDVETNGNKTRIESFTVERLQ
jgi:hypothetical protein